MRPLFSVALDFDDDAYRNIRSAREPQDLLDDLSDDPAARAFGQAAAIRTQVPKGTDPVINRPFEYAQAIAHVFGRPPWAATRFSDGGHPAWYGALELETTIWETVHHWHRFLTDSGFDRHDQPVIGERRVFKVRCTAILLDLRGHVAEYPGLVDPHDYRFAQEVGARVAAGGPPGLLTHSARCNGDNLVVFRPDVLSRPRGHCFLEYELAPGTPFVRVRRMPAAEVLLRVPIGSGASASE